MKRTTLYHIKSIITTALLGSIFSVCGCKKFVTVPAPTTSVTSPTVFDNTATATSAVLSIYTQMYGNADSYSLAHNTGTLSDELTSYSSITVFREYYQNAMNAIDITPAQGYWANGYKYIYQANAVIAGLQASPGVTGAAKQQLIGEAYFVRAFCHFNLANAYGDVPLALTNDYTVTAKLPRTAQNAVYQQVISDLGTAIGLLNDNYVDVSDTSATSERVRPNKSVAEALLAKVYLYLGDYDNHNSSDYQAAIKASNAVIGKTALYSLVADPNNVFLKNSTEAIWQIQQPTPNTLSGATQDGQYFILNGAPSNQSTSNNCALSTQLLGAFEPADNRRGKWISSISVGANTYYFPFKYKYTSKNAGGTVREYNMVFRLAEQYLIRAEAEAELNQLSAAANDLNVIRNRAGLANTTAATQSALLAAIWHERQVELFTEWGNRWFDLRRTGQINAVMSMVTPTKLGTWSSNQALFPIPFAEISANPNLTQNPGY